MIELIKYAFVKKKINISIKVIFINLFKALDSRKIKIKFAVRITALKIHD